MIVTVSLWAYDMNDIFIFRLSILPYFILVQQ